MFVWLVVIEPIRYPAGVVAELFVNNFRMAGSERDES
jgi:hypothetical protein